MSDVFDKLARTNSPVKQGGYRTGNKDGLRQDRPSFGSMDPVGKVELFERCVIFGPDLRTTEVPERTAMADSSPVLTFSSPYNESFGMNDDMISKHLLMLGATGQGKSNTFYQIIGKLMERMQKDPVKDSAMLIFDTKGDFFRRFYDKNNPNHIVIGNEDIYKKVSPAWNIFLEVFNFSGPTPVRTLELRLKEMASHLFRGRESETQPFFHLAAADLFVKFVIDYALQKKTFTTSALVSELKNTDAQKMLKMIERNPDFASARSYLGDPSRLTPQALGILAYLNSMVNDLFQGVFAENRSTGEVSMRKLVHDGKGKVIFLEYDLSVGEVLGPMYSLLIDLALKEALTRQEDERAHLYLVVDEFKLLPDLQHIENALNYGRSKGIRVFAGIQSVSQIYEIYGEDKGKSILSGFLNCFAFKTLDKESREYTSERFGKNYSNMNYKSASNQHTVQREGYAVEDWDILDLDVGDAYIDLLGYPPFRFHFRKYK